MPILTLLKQIFFLLTILLASFILVHFLALFGLFLSLALPLLHLVFYPHILCFWCRLTHTPHRLRHTFIDSGLILGLTLISLALVYGEYTLIRRSLNPTTPQIAQFTIPSKNQYQVGEIFPLPIDLERIPAAINVFQADLSFDPTLLEVVDLTTDGSFASFFVQKEYDNAKGYLRLSGGVPNPGYRQAVGHLGTAYFKVKATGATELVYLESSLVLANDGKGTNLLADFPKLPLLLLPSTNPAPSALPSDLTIRTQIKGDTDKTVLSFAEYAEALPLPYTNVQGTSDATPAPSLPTSSISLPQLLLQFDTFILSFWHR